MVSISFEFFVQFLNIFPGTARYVNASFFHFCNFNYVFGLKIEGFQIELFLNLVFVLKCRHVGPVRFTTVLLPSLLAKDGLQLLAMRTRQAKNPNLFRKKHSR